MKRMHAGIELAAVGVVLAFASGCGSPGSQTLMPPMNSSVRAFRFVINPANSYAPPTIEARTADSTYRVTTNDLGEARITIDNAAVLPRQLVFTVDGLAVLPTATCAGTAPGFESLVRVHCPASPSNVLVRAQGLVHLGDGVSDGVHDDFQLAPAGAETSYGFTLLAIPKRMPSYQVWTRGMESYVEVRVNGVLVSRFRPPSDPAALTVQADTLLGSPATVFQLTQNVLTLRTVGLASDASNLDDVEVGAVALYFP